ncbi:hypothetical protein ACFQU2_03465 [Siccirubricoccus deserti]
MRIILAVALAALLPAAPSPAQPAKPRATPAPAAAPHPVSPAAAVAMLPETIAGWRRGAVTDFSPRPGGAGLGAAVEYRPEAGGAGVATVYVYDRGRTRLRDGADRRRWRRNSTPRCAKSTRWGRSGTIGSSHGGRPRHRPGCVARRW